MDPLARATRFFMGTAEVQLAARRLAAKLEELGIPYAICGGLAVFAHGYERTTADVDVLLTAQGLDRFKREALGRGWLEKFAGSRGVKDAEHRVPIDVLVTGGVPGRSGRSLVRFRDPAAIAVEKGGCRYVSLATLIEMKLASGLDSTTRYQDFADVVNLIRVNRLAEDFADRLHEEVQPKYRELWRDVQREPLVDA
jgi:hypothetical protein